MARTSAVSRSGRREGTIESKAKESRGRINEFPPPIGGETFTLAKRWSKANILSSCVSSKRERKRERFSSCWDSCWVKKVLIEKFYSSIPLVGMEQFLSKCVFSR